VSARPFLTIAAVVCSCMAGCTLPRKPISPTATPSAPMTVQYLKDISQVSYTSESGTILPEGQWYEEIVITRDKVTLVRNGKTANTIINAGTWEFAVDEQQVAAFFEQLQAVDCSSIKKVEPEMLTVGGGIEFYSIVYAGDKRFTVSYGQGRTYTDGMLIVELVDAFIKGLAMPAGAANRYKSEADPP
jgi:hypothetical protein